MNQSTYDTSCCCCCCSGLGRWDKSQTMSVGQVYCIQRVEAEAGADAIPHSLPALGVIPEHFRGWQGKVTSLTRATEQQMWSLPDFCPRGSELPRPYDRRARHWMLPSSIQTINRSGLWQTRGCSISPHLGIIIIDQTAITPVASPR